MIVVNLEQNQQLITNWPSTLISFSKTYISISIQFGSTNK